jgi:hypothetical protein
MDYSPKTPKGRTILATGSVERCAIARKAELFPIGLLVF